MCVLDGVAKCTHTDIFVHASMCLYVCISIMFVRCNSSSPPGIFSKLTLDIKGYGGVVALGAVGSGHGTHQLLVPLPGLQRERAVAVRLWTQLCRVFR